MIILTISPKSNRGNNAYRLAVRPRDNNSIEYFVHDEVVLLVHMDNIIELKYRHTDSCKNELDSTQNQLNEWILRNNFHRYPVRKPTKLVFTLNENDGVRKLMFVGRN